MIPFDHPTPVEPVLTPDNRLDSVQRAGGPLQAMTHLLWSVGARTSLKVWNRLTVYGAEYLPRRPPFVLVANHASHLDALVLAAPLPLRIRNHVYSLAAGDVFFDTGLRALIASGLINALPLWRHKPIPQALKELRERLVSEPCGYILFPEGARSRDGNYLRFRPGVGMLVAGTDVPVVPCHLSGTLEALPAGTWLPRPRRITLRVGEPLRFADLPNARAGWQTVLARVEAAVKGLGARR